MAAQDKDIPPPRGAGRGERGVPSLKAAESLTLGEMLPADIRSSCLLTHSGGSSTLHVGEKRRIWPPEAADPAICCCYSARFCRIADTRLPRLGPATIISLIGEASAFSVRYRSAPIFPSSPAFLFPFPPMCRILSLSLALLPPPIAPLCSWLSSTRRTYVGRELGTQIAGRHLHVYWRNHMLVMYQWSPTW